MTTGNAHTPVRILIAGPNGKMGKAMIQIAARNPKVMLVGGVGPRSCSYCGMDLAQIAGLREPVGAIAHGSAVSRHRSEQRSTMGWNGLMPLCIARGRMHYCTARLPTWLAKTLIKNTDT